MCERECYQQGNFSMTAVNIVYIIVYHHTLSHIHSYHAALQTTHHTPLTTTHHSPLTTHHHTPPHTTTPHHTTQHYTSHTTTHHPHHTTPASASALERRDVRPYSAGLPTIRNGTAIKTFCLTAQKKSINKKSSWQTKKKVIFF